MGQQVGFRHVACALPLAAAALFAIASPLPLVWHGVASAQDVAMSPKEAFDTAKELGTLEAWNAFLESYPDGFLSDLARAYVKKLSEGGATEPAPAKTAEDPPAPKTPPKAAAREAATQMGGDGVAAPGVEPGKPALARGAKYMGFAERFNRYYTDRNWKPPRTIYVSPDGSGDGASAENPARVREAFASSEPGTKIHFLRGNYEGCFQLSKDTGGTYDEPVVLYAERNDDKSIGVSVQCCASGRETCFNLEGANYVAVDGFHMIGGKYGVRSVGEGYESSKHALGIAVLNNTAHYQARDPFFSGQSDWAVWEANLGFGAKEEDGHGIYISNGSDWNIVRFNETYGNLSSDFQINADPQSTCLDVGIPVDDPRCDAYAGEGEGGQGASDYFLVEGNYFHHGLANGPNFTSVRRSIVRNNIFGPQDRHNVSFWQETDNPKLGSSDNKILHNIFITTGRHGVQFSVNSTRNEFVNNVLVGVAVDGGTVSANPSALLMEVDGTAGDNVYRGNIYISGRLEGREPGKDELRREDFSSAWFKRFPASADGAAPAGLSPASGAPFAGVGTLSPDATADRNGIVRSGKVDLGPIEAK
jgi:hypothetical protein